MWQLAELLEYLCSVFLQFLYLPSSTQWPKILNFPSISDIDMLVGNSINFPLNRRRRWSRALANLVIFTLRAPTQCRECSNELAAGYKHPLVFLSPSFSIHSGGKLCCTLVFSEWSLCRETLPSRVACLGHLCGAEMDRKKGNWS